MALGKLGAGYGRLGSVGGASRTPTPAFSFNFAALSALPPNTSFARADAVATYFDSSGNLQTAALNAPRFGYDFWSRKPIGIISEPATTNSIRNNTMVGAAAGTPGTPPTNWAITGANGLSTQIVGTGTQNNINYVDIRIFGTSTTATETNIFYETTSGIASGNGTAWAVSAYLQIVGGNNNNLFYIVQDLDMISGAAADLGFVGNGTGITANISSFGWLRFSDRFTTNNASVASVRPCLRVYPPATIGAAIDITLRIGMPQAEANQASATSVIATSGTAVSRNADSPSFTGAVATLLAGTSYSVIAKFNSGSSNYAIIGAKNTNYPGLGFTNPNYTTSNGFGVSQLNATPTDSTTINSVGLSVGGAARYLTSNGGTLHGGTTASDALAVGIGPNFGTGSGAGYSLTGALISLAIYDRPLSQAQVQSLTNSVETVPWGDSLTDGTGSQSPGVNYGYTGYLGALTQGVVNKKGFAGQGTFYIIDQMIADTTHTNDNVIFATGRNDINGDIPGLIAKIQSGINHLAAGNTRYVVMSVINSTAENSAASGASLTAYNWIKSFNAALAAAFPGHYIDDRTVIVSTFSGANDAPPNSVMFNGSVHPNDDPYKVRAQQIYNFAQAAGWPGY